MRRLIIVFLVLGSVLLTGCETPEEKLVLTAMEQYRTAHGKVEKATTHLDCTDALRYCKRAGGCTDSKKYHCDR